MAHQQYQSCIEAGAAIALTASLSRGREREKAGRRRGC
jgi:hypothetical protein